MKKLLCWLLGHKRLVIECHAVRISTAVFRCRACGAKGTLQRLGKCGIVK